MTQKHACGICVDPTQQNEGGLKQKLQQFTFSSCRLTVKSFTLFCGCGISELLLTNLPSCVRKMEMFHRFRSVVGTVHTQPPLSQHYSPHLTACRICALKVLAHASQVPLWLTAKGKARQKSQCMVPGLLALWFTQFCSSSVLPRTQGSVFPLFSLWSPTPCRPLRLQLCQWKPV